MARRPARDLTIGAVFALALIILALAVMVVGGDAGPWLKRSEFRMVFLDATGLLVGAPVRMAGVQVGIVTGIHLPTEPTETGIEVTVGVDLSYTERVRADSRAALRILQVLTNEKYVEIIPGSPSEPVLDPGSTIPRVMSVGVVERGEAIADDLGEITVSLKNILSTMERGEGLLGQMLKDPEFGKAGLESLGGTLANLNILTADLVQGKGTLGRLLHDEELAGKLDSLGSAIDDLAGIAKDLAGEEGGLAELLAEGGSARQALDDLRDAAASFKALAERLESDEGLMGRLLNDTEYSDALARDLQATVENVADITGKIANGEGTLGLLVNERTLHDGAEDVVAGVNDSKFARWLTRRYRKKGIKAAEAQDQEADAGSGGGGP